MNGGNLTTAQAVLNASFVIVGRGLIIDLGGGNAIILPGITKADISAANIQISAAEGLSAPAPADDPYWY